ncbi:MAG: tetratricopeptide repeat protein [Verrucomicrobiota bacterium]|jgi:tetratricopeptide (TPR) repeat protein
MLGTLNPSEEAQLRQTIEMFEVITQSQPQDYQSLEILKEAYLKLGLESEVIQTSKRIAQAYVQLGQLSSAILEFETILQRHPEDHDAMQAMAQIESQANNLNKPPPMEVEPATTKSTVTTLSKKAGGKAAPQIEVDDGRAPMHKIFVESKLISAGDFDMYWPEPKLNAAPAKTEDPFIQVLAEKQVMPLDKSLKLLADRSRLAYVPLDRYELDMDLARNSSRECCQRWCVLPFDRMSKTVLVATCNPFNKQAAIDLASTLKNRLLWYLASPADLLRILGKIFR